MLKLLEGKGRETEVPGNKCSSQWLLTLFFTKETSLDKIVIKIDLSK